jgi:predicted Zn-dependent peptidase
MCAKPKETVLPNGMTVFCLQREEVPLLYQQVQEYLKKR